MNSFCCLAVIFTFAAGCFTVNFPLLLNGNAKFYVEPMSNKLCLNAKIFGEHEKWDYMQVSVKRLTEHNAPRHLRVEKRVSEQAATFKSKLNPATKESHKSIRYLTIDAYEKFFMQCGKHSENFTLCKLDSLHVGERINLEIVVCLNFSQKKFKSIGCFVIFLKEHASSQQIDVVKLRRSEFLSTIDTLVDVESFEWPSATSPKHAAELSEQSMTLAQHTKETKSFDFNLIWQTELPHATWEKIHQFALE